MNLEVVGNLKTRIEMLQLLALLQDRSSHSLSATLVQVAKKRGCCHNGGAFDIEG
jgi:hypothetical protein